MYAPTMPATPALMCTTVPPAKSSAPHCQSRPALSFMASTTLAVVYASGPIQNQTMCAIGRYENVNQSTVKTNTAENLTRSANPPRINAQVIAAKVAWKATKASSGMTTPLLNVAAVENSPFTASNVPFKNNRSNPPMYFPSAPLPSVNAKL